MIARESGIIAGIGWAFAAWAWAFTCALAYWADDVTSKQWQFLMTIPGHQWTWVGLFGTGATVLAVGMATARYRLRAAGLLVIGLSCLGIATFYAWAPILNGLVTLGSFPWLIPTGITAALAVLNWFPIRWF